MTELSARWVAFIERRHRRILAGSLLLTAVAALSLLALRFDFDVLDMLPRGTPAFDNFRLFVAEFGELNELVVLVSGEEPAALHRFADAFSKRLAELDTVVAVRGKLDADATQRGIFGRYLYNYVAVEAYAELATRLTPEGIDAQLRADRALLQAPFDLSAAQWVRRDPLGIARLALRTLRATGGATLDVSGGYVSAPDGSALLIMAHPRQNAFDIAFTTRFMDQVRAAEAAARRETRAPDSLRVGYTGSYAFALEDAATLKADVARYTLLALAGVLAVFYAGYRHLRILPFVTYPLIVSTLLTFAASLLCYAQLNAVSIAFAAILYGLSIDSGIHYYTRLLQELRAHELRAAIARTLAHLGGASVVASGTTAAAFCVIGFSRLTGVSQLGFLTAIGMLINIAELFLVYPALSFWMRRRTLTDTPLDTPRLGRLGATAAAHARGVLAVVSLCGVGLLALARGVTFDVDLTHLRPADTPAMRVQDEIAQRFGARDSAGAVLVQAAGLESALRTSERLAEQLVRYQREEGLVHAVHGITPLLPPAHTQRERLAALQQLPRRRIVEDLRAALARQGFVAAPFDDFITDFLAEHDAIVTLDDPALEPLAAVLARYVHEQNGRFTVATYIEPAVGVHLATIAERLHHDLPHLAFVVSGRPLLEEELARLLSRELLGFGIAAFLLNLLLLRARFPRLTTVVILLPEVLVIAACLALMRLVGLGIDPVNLIIGPLILGIGVDNCVYVAERARRGEPVGEALRHSGRALVISAFTTMAGFGFLGLSTYPALAHMGALAAGGLFLCFVAAVIVLPALLAVLAPAVISRHLRW